MYIILRYYLRGKPPLQFISVGSRSRLLTYRDYACDEGKNFVNYYEFDSNGYYSSYRFCDNVLDIGIIDNNFVAYLRDDSLAYSIALSLGISNYDESVIYRSHFSSNCDICFDEFNEPYIKCEEAKYHNYLR